MEHTDEQLIALAKEVCENAYAPFSKFQVGAAVLTSKGEVFTGCNVENSSYGLTICAERSAIFQAVAKSGPGLKIDKVAIYTPTEELIPPCGACRQVMNEFAEDLQIIISNKNNDVATFTLKELLPNAFRLSQ